jgi:hypothetical protein
MPLMYRWYSSEVICSGASVRGTAPTSLYRSRSIEPVHLLAARELPRGKRDRSLPLLHSEHILPDAPYNLEHEKERETNKFQHELTDNQFYAH